MKTKRLYSLASNIYQRCRNPKSPKYHRYGGRGIECRIGGTRKEIFLFLMELDGYFDGAEIDRIDNDGHYEKGNLRWVTRSENVLNSTNCKDKEYYKTKDICRGDFKRICIRRGWVFSEFEEIYSGIKTKSNEKKYYYKEI